MYCDYLSPSFGYPFCVLAPGLSPAFLASAVLNTIRGFRDFNSVNLFQQQPVFLCLLFSSPYSMYCTLSSTQCVCAKLANRACHVSCNRFFSWGYDPYTHACKARPLTTFGRTSLSVVIIIPWLHSIVPRRFCVAMSFWRTPQMKRRCS